MKNFAKHIDVLLEHEAQASSANHLAANGNTSGKAHGGEAYKKPESHERPIEKTGDEKDFEIIALTWAQRQELAESFPHLFNLIVHDLNTNIQKIPPQGFLGTEEEITTAFQSALNTLDCVKAIALPPSEAAKAEEQFKKEHLPQLPPPTPEESQIMGIKSYLHALDVLKPDRQRLNPIAKKSTGRLPQLLNEARRMFPKDFKATKPKISHKAPKAEAHPTVMLPPPNPKLQGDLLLELSTIKKDKK